MIATEPLSPKVVRRLIPNARVLADTRRLLNYFRLSPDGTRLLWGGRVGSGHLDPRVSATRLHRAMRTVFPDLAGARVTHSWSGNVAFTFDFLPHIGSEGGVHYALGCQGSGVAMQTWLGTQAALKIAGVASRPSAFDGLKFPTVPMYTGRPWFLPGVLAWYRLRDSIDRMAA
jgi:glycine/D-amino acid oxidase-like deaminating enzyme